MKTLNKMKVAVAVMLLSAIAISSCQKEEFLKPSVQEKSKSSIIIKDISHLNDIEISSRKSCDNDLEANLDICTFTSGEGDLTIYAIDFVQKLNSCHSYKDVKWCKWLDNYKTVSQDLYFNLGPSDECKTNVYYNNVLNTVGQDSKNVAPNDYDVFSYDLIEVVQESGSWVLKIRVNYRRNSCLEKVTAVKNF
jgi:hypothetical protein